MDVERQSSEPFSESAWKKLEFESEELDLGSLEISFNTEQTKDGKVRIRIHSNLSESKDEPRSPTLVGSPAESLGFPLGLPSPASDASFPSFSFQSHDVTNADIPAADLHANPFSAQYSQVEPLAHFLGMSPSPFDLSASGCHPAHIEASSRRRVRIALKSLPQAGGDGGEWEVEVR